MDRTSHIVGLIVFALGIVILLFVFATSLWLFVGPAERLLPGADGSRLIPSVSGLGSAAALMFIRIALLFIMAIAGSMIAGRGVDLYLGSRERRRGQESDA